MASMSIWS